MGSPKEQVLEKEVFATFFITSLIQTLITSKRKIVKEFRRRHWFCHENIFQKRLKNFLFL
jgi:hypothetical protein